MLLRRELNLVRRHSRWVDPPLSSTLFFNTNNNPSKCVRFDQPPHATNPISYQDFLLLLVRASKKQKQSMTRGWWVGRVWEEGKKSTSTWNEIAEPTAGPKQKKNTEQQHLVGAPQAVLTFSQSHRQPLAMEAVAMKLVLWYFSGCPFFRFSFSRRLVNFNHTLHTCLSWPQQPGIKPFFFFLTFHLHRISKSNRVFLDSRQDSSGNVLTGTNERERENLRPTTRPFRWDSIATAIISAEWRHAQLN